MKAFYVASLWLFLMAPCLCAQYDQGFGQVLEAFIKEDNRTADKTTRDRIASSWPGIKTMDGVRSMVQELLKPTGGDRRSRTFAILRRSELPRDQIVSYLLESAEAHRANPELLVRHFFLFSEYPEDDRILKFLAPLLSDRGFPDPIRPLEPREERSSEARWRMCDAAHGMIIQVLEKRGEIKPGDPGYGDPGGEATIGKRETNIGELKTVLVKAGYMDGAQAAANPPPEPLPPQTNPPSNAPAPGNLAIGIPKDDEPEPQPPVTVSETPPPPAGVNWFLWLLVPIAALTLVVLLVWKRRV